MPSPTGASPPRVGHATRARPAALSSFLGRAEEISAVAESLDADRLVTLSGPPGIGKTRLALQVAKGIGDGVAFVELAPVDHPAQVSAALASALSVREGSGQRLDEALLAHLRRRPLLLVLDNCEHLVRACAALVEGLLRDCPNLRVLATSRQPLEIAAERVLIVPPLPVPADARAPVPPEELIRFEAVRLFVERAVAVHPGFVLSPYVAPAVADICRRLDGIPLAIELASASIEVLTPAELAARLDDRFSVLTDRSRHQAPHHQTLEAAIDWSHELLSPPERTLLRRLSVFAGDFGLEPAAAICAGEEVEVAGVADLLGRLVARSLVVAGVGDADRPRYRLLETIRAYAGDRLDEAGETARLREAHARHHLAFAERAELELTGPEQQLWFERLERERQEIRAAFDWSLGCGHGWLALRLAGALVLFWRVRCRFREGRDLLEASLAAENGAARGSGPASEAATADAARVRAKALWGAGFMALMADDVDDAIPRLEQSLACFRSLGDLRGCARALLLLGNCRQYRADPAVTSLGLLEQSAALARQGGDPWCLAHALGMAGFEHCVRHELSAARPLLEQCVTVARAAQDRQGLRVGLLGLGEVAVRQGDRRAAEPLLEEAVAIAEELGEDYTKARALQDLGELALDDGAYDRARELLDGAVALVREVGPPAKCVPPLVFRAQLARAEGEPGRASALLEEALVCARAAQDAGLLGGVLRELAQDGADGPEADLGEGASAREAIAAAPRRPGTRVQPARGRTALTRRERQAAALVAEGLTNAEIAERLRISHGSVKDHLSHAYAKLGIASRAELAREVARGETHASDPAGC